MGLSEAFSPLGNSWDLLLPLRLRTRESDWDFSLFRFFPLLPIKYHLDFMEKPPMGSPHRFSTLWRPPQYLFLLRRCQVPLLLCETMNSTISHFIFIKSHLKWMKKLPFEPFQPFSSFGNLLRLFWSSFHSRCHTPYGDLLYMRFSYSSASPHQLELEMGVETPDGAI
jgi:hypothetical protein